MSQYNNKSSEKRADAHVNLQKFLNNIIFQEVPLLYFIFQIYEKYVDETSDLIQIWKLYSFLNKIPLEF